MGAWFWRTAAIEHTTISQARIAHEITRRLLGPEPYTRVNIPLERPYALDDYGAAKNLVEPGAQAARAGYSDLIRRFFSSAAVIGRARKASVESLRRSDCSRRNS